MTNSRHPGGIFVGMRLDPISNASLKDCFLKIEANAVKQGAIVRTIATHNIAVPLAYTGTAMATSRLSFYKPHGKFEPVCVPLKELQIRRLGEYYKAVELTFECDWLKSRFKELVHNHGFKARHKYQPRIPMAFSCYFFDPKWVSLITLKEIYLYEEFCIPFYHDYPRTAHKELTDGNS